MDDVKRWYDSCLRLVKMYKVYIKLYTAIATCHIQSKQLAVVAVSLTY